MQFCGSAEDNKRQISKTSNTSSSRPLDSVLRLKLDPQPAIVRLDNENSGVSDSLKTSHQLSQLPN